MKKIDLTEKLKWAEKPIIKIKDTEIKVNNDAASVLKLVSCLKKLDADSMIEAAELLFSPEEKEKLDALGLCFEDYMTVIVSAAGLTGGENEGEAPTHTTT